MPDSVADLSGVADAYPLTAAQSGMLFHTLADPHSGVYVGAFSARLGAEVDLDRFKRAWGTVARRHTALRSVFVWKGLETPVQVVLDEPNLQWETLGLPWAAEDRAAQMLDLQKGGVDLSTAPSGRLVLLQGDAGEVRLVWLCHHALIDVWSADLVMRDVARAYAGLAPPEDAMAFRDFVDWSVGRDAARAETFWRDTLGDFHTPALIQLPPPDSAPTASGGQGAASAVLDAEAVSALSAAARGLGVTASSVIGAAWGIVLHRLTGRDNVLFGVAATLRPPELPGALTAVGNFVTTLPARVRLDAPPDLAALIRAFHAQTVEARDNGTLSLSDIQDLSGLPNSAEMFETILSVETRSDAFGNLAPVFEDVEARDRSNFPFSLICALGEDLRITLTHDPDRLDPAGARMIVDMVAATLRALPHGLDRPALDLTVMAPDAQVAAMAGLSGGPLTPTDALHRAILAQAAATPDATAVTGPDETLSYRDLDERSRALAQRLVSRGLRTGDRVALVFEREPAAIVAMLGVLRAGAAYVPVDASHGAARTASILDGCKPACILTRAALHPILPEGCGPVILTDDMAALDTAVTLPEVTGEDIAYVIYTSGSTGTPKGVEITHDNLAASTGARLTFYERPPGTFLLLSSIAFDSSVVGIYWTLATGGTLVLPSSGGETDIRGLSALIERCEVTSLLALPSLLAMLCDYGSAGALARFTFGIAAGEELTRRTVEAWYAAMPGADLYNEYGPTEASVWCVATRIAPGPEGSRMPIGRPIPGVKAFIRDDRERPVPDGLVGELWVGGPNVARGYADAPDLTAERFVAGPARDGCRLFRTGDLVRRRPDGDLEYLGRADQQVKIRGHRVELAEIEAHLESLPDIRQAVVNPVAHGPDLQLVGYVVCEHDATLSVDGLRGDIAARLPAWMQPARYVTLADLPKTATGKVDRAALPPPPAERRETRAPRTALETELAAIWKEVLWLDRAIGIDEDFFDLGGHSLLSIRLMNEVEERLELTLPNDMLGRLSTVADQAQRIEEVRKRPVTTETVPVAATASRGIFEGLNPDEIRKVHAHMAGWPGEPVWDGCLYRGLNTSGTKPPLFWCFSYGFEFANIAEALGPDQPIYGTRSGHLVLDIRPDTQQHENRRVALTSVQDLLRISPDGPYFIGGNCQGAAVAMETAQVLQGLALPVDLLFMFEAITDHVFHGRVAMIFGEDSDENPARLFDDPEAILRQRFRDLSIDMIACGHGCFFQPPHLKQVANTIARRLAEARGAAAVGPSAYRVAWQSPASALRFEGTDMQEVPVTVTNLGAGEIAPTERSDVRLAWRWKSSADMLVGARAGAVDLEEVIPAGGSARFDVPVVRPGNEDAATLEIDLVVEGVSWLAERGVPPLRLPLYRAPAAQQGEAPTPLLLTQAHAAHAAGEDARAERLARAALMVDPNRPEALALLSDLADRRGDPVRARLLIKQAIRSGGPEEWTERSLALKRRFTRIQALRYGWLKWRDGP